MIQRFEDEYPETRLQPPEVSETVAETSDTASRASVGSTDQATSEGGVATDSITVPDADEDEDEEARKRARHASDVSMASRALSLEEGRIHRIGQQVRRDIFGSPQHPNHHHQPNGDNDQRVEITEQEAKDEEERRGKVQATIDALSGEEIRERVVSGNWEATIRKIKESAHEHEHGHEPKQSMTSSSVSSVSSATAAAAAPQKRSDRLGDFASFKEAELAAEADGPVADNGGKAK